MYLTAAVAALGLAVYLSSFGPLFTRGRRLLHADAARSRRGRVAARRAARRRRPAAQAEGRARAGRGALGAGLPAGDRRSCSPRPTASTIDWGLYLIIAFSVIQAIVAVAVLLFDAGVITAPAPRPKYEQQQYGQYGGPGPVLRTAASARRPAAPAGPAAAASGLPVARTAAATRVARRPADSPAGHQGGPPTPPTGFPTYGQPPSSSRADRHRCRRSNQPSSSSQSGPPPS